MTLHDRNKKLVARLDHPSTTELNNLKVVLTSYTSDNRFLVTKQIVFCSSKTHASKGIKRLFGGEFRSSKQSTEQTKQSIVRTHDLGVNHKWL